jgi:hypothetical protein
MLSLRPLGLPEGFLMASLNDDAALEPFQSDFQAETIVTQLVFGPQFAERSAPGDVGIMTQSFSTTSLCFATSN